MPGSREESPVQANMLPKYCKVSLGEKMVKRILYFVVKRLNGNGSQEQAACRRDCKVQESDVFSPLEKGGHSQTLRGWAVRSGSSVTEQDIGSEQRAFESKQGEYKLHI